MTEKNRKKISGKIQLYLITAPFPKNSQSPVPYRRPLAVPYRHPLAVPYNAPPCTIQKYRERKMLKPWPRSVSIICENFIKYIKNLF